MSEETDALLMVGQLSKDEAFLSRYTSMAVTNDRPDVLGSQPLTASHLGRGEATCSRPAGQSCREPERTGYSKSSKAWGFTLPVAGVVALSAARNAGG